jgi:hypothetical protein
MKCLNMHWRCPTFFPSQGGKANGNNNMHHMQYGEGYYFKCDVICFSMGSKCYKFFRVRQSFIRVHAPTRDRHESKMSQNALVSITTNETPLFPFFAPSRQNIYIPKVAVRSRKTSKALSFTEISVIEGWYGAPCKNICASSTHKEQLNFPLYN